MSDYCADNIAEYTDLTTFTDFLASVTDDKASVTSAESSIDVKAQKTFCDSDNLALCTESVGCSAVGGDWLNNICTRTSSFSWSRVDAKFPADGLLKLVNHPVTNAPTFAYYNYSIEPFFSIYEGGEWKDEFLRGIATNYLCGECNIMIDYHPLTGFPGVYFINDNGDLTVSTASNSNFRDGGVQTEIAVTGVGTGMFNSFVYDGNGESWITFNDYDPVNQRWRLRDAHKKTFNQWEVGTILEDAIAASFLVRNPISGYPSLGIITFDYTTQLIQLNYAYYNGSSWVLELVDNDPVKSNRSYGLAFHSNGEPALAYHGVDSIKYASRYSGGWAVESVSNVTDSEFAYSDINYQVALAINPISDLPAISYQLHEEDAKGVFHRPGMNSKLIYLSKSSAGWAKEIVDSVMTTSASEFHTQGTALTFSNMGEARIWSGGGYYYQLAD